MSARTSLDAVLNFCPALYRQVCDVGAGLGLGGIGAALAGAREVCVLIRHSAASGHAGRSVVDADFGGLDSVSSRARVAPLMVFARHLAGDAVRLGAPRPGMRSEERRRQPPQLCGQGEWAFCCAVVALQVLQAPSG